MAEVAFEKEVNVYLECWLSQRVACSNSNIVEQKKNLTSIWELSFNVSNKAKGCIRLSVLF